MRLIFTFRGGIETEALRALHDEGVFSIGGAIVSREDQSVAGVAFPFARLHCVEDVFASGLSGKYPDVDVRLLTPEFLEAVMWAEPIALAMIDRIDVQRAFTYKQRLDVYLYLLAYWRKVVEEEDLTMFYPRETPHEVADYVLFVVMKALGRDVRNVAWTSVPGRWFLVDDYRHPRQVFAPADNRETCFDDALFSRLVDPLRGTYDAARPLYRGAPLEPLAASPPRSSIGAVWRACVVGASLGVGGVRVATRALRQPPRADYPRVPQVLAKVANSWQVAHDARRLKDAYERRASDVPDGLDFVYYLPGYQPEVTNCPEGGSLGNQILAIALLAESLPSGWEVVVKEHPVQLRNGDTGVGDYGYLGRDTAFYAAVAGIEGVRFARLDSDHFGLMDAARVVATLTGTAGWEASVRGKPVFCLGEAWYEGAPNVFTVRNSTMCKAAYDAVLVGDVLRGGALEVATQAFVRKIYETTHELVFDELDGRNSRLPFDPEFQRSNLTKILREQLGRLA